MTTFEDLQLTAPLLKALGRCGHNLPTPVQAEAIPKALAGHDLIASAQTGTGKTAAFMLPTLQRLATTAPAGKSGFRALVLTPTRELAAQITQVGRAYARYLKVSMVAIVGGMPFAEQLRALAQGPDIIVATPGRLIDHIWRGRIDLSRLEILVLDEADRMLDMGFISDVELVADAVPENCQTLFFAATMGEEATRLAGKFMKSPARVEVAPGMITHDRIEQRLHLADNLQHKNSLLHHLCEDATMTRAIIFSATKRDTESLARELNAKGHRVAALHGDMSQVVRNRTIANLRQGKIRLLVATDVAARGLDITGISHVINFDLPRSAEDYVNRIGRTGRAGESGTAISFASRGDLPYLDRIESYLGRNLPVQVVVGLEPRQPMRSQAGGRGQAGRARTSAEGSGPSGGNPRHRVASGSRSGRFKDAGETGRRSDGAGPHRTKRDRGVAAEHGRSGKTHPGRVVATKAGGKIFM